MDLEYDQKFEEMKKYIPFLESMIKRLESTSAASANPRQAQLDKIRSLRDLLLDKKKRMKMENLLKCEQVLVNLYTKVEQRDTLPGLTLASNPVQTSKSKNKDNELELVRNKLKNVTAKRVEEGQETLPEIARASIIEELCTPGSKEPALFQRRPNKASISPGRSPKSPNKSTNINASKRNYTRVLVSPEPNSNRWEPSETTSDKPLFSRRSPRRSPKRYSPTHANKATHTKKDRKKSSKQGQSKKAKDLNITLNVPEESLDSLNSKDILSRIMNCSDNDVDIETLREAKRQILNELKHTGAKCDDISDLLLKSYKNTGDSKKIDEVEEGELSDSESEAIQSIYGNFILDDDENTSKVKDKENKEKPRKIKICLVINSDKDDPSGDMKNDDTVVPCNTDTTDFEMYNKNSLSNVKENNIKSEPVFSEKKGEQNQKQSVNTTLVENKLENHQDISSTSQDVTKIVENKTEKVHNTEIYNSSIETRQTANFYKPLKDEQKPSGSSTEETKDNSGTSETLKSSSITDNLPEIAAYLKGTENNEKATVEIPLLNEPSVTQKPKKDVVSEIDILQALKNEILSESLSIPGSETTPLLHQPKLTKVASAQEIAPKKRISIEKYKKKSAAASTSTANSLFLNDSSFSLIDDSSSSWKEDNLKKQSLKLTEKECERFFSAKLNSDDDTDDDDARISDIDEPDTDLISMSLNDIYDNLAPKSPDHDEPSTNKNQQPVIIPVDPVKATLTPSKADVDMRKLATMLSPNSLSPSSNNATKNDQTFLKNRIDKTRISSDPRMRRDINQVANIDSSSVSTQLSSNRTPRSLLPTPVMVPNTTPNRAPIITSNMTPNRVMTVLPDMSPCMTPTMAPNMTPNRNPNMTPRQSFGIDDNSSRKHVYAPIYQCDNDEQSVAIEQERRFYWEKSEKEKTRRRDGSRWDLAESRDVNPNRDLRSSSVHREIPDFSKSRFGEYYNHCDNFNPKYNERRDAYSRADCPRTPLPSFGRQDGSTTPSHTFGRLDAPMTPIHPFGRSDCPPTPNQFSRADCPLTPSHPFGRPDCTQTLNHPLGRNECPSTPSHPFGRVEMPMTPGHPFGRSEPQSRDPRLNRGSDYDYHLNDNSYISETSNSETYREHRERSERYNYSERGGSHYNKEKTFYRESSAGRALSRDFKTDRLFSRDRVYGRAGDEHYNKNDSNADSRTGFYREQSMGRSIHSDGRSIGRARDNTVYALSVKPDAGTSFTIDTSVRSTFQDFLDSGRHRQVFDNNFDNRRKRAASVGRTLCRESSVSRSFHDKPKKIIVSTNNINKNNFRRARSVGRDILTSETERSFKDIKADFEKYRLDHNLHNPRGLNKSIDNREPKQKDKSSDIKEPRKNDRPSDIKETRRSDKQFDVKEPRRHDKLFDVKEQKRTDKPFDTKDPNRTDKPFDAKDPKRTDKPFDVKEPKRTDKPFDVKEPKRTDKPFDVKEPRKNDKPFISNKPTNRTSNRDAYQSGNIVLGNKKPYSPRKNSRDPRFSREVHYSKNKYNIDNQRDKEKRNIGIVYSNDNITKGTILGTGYGVKNYKIPKIKRPVEEKDVKIEEKKENKMDEKKENKIDEKKENKMDEKKADNKVEKTVEKNEIIEEKVAEKKEDLRNDNIDVPKPQRVKKTSQGTKTKILNKPDEKIESNKTAENILQNDTEQVEKCEKRVTRLSKKADSLLQSADEDSIVITRRTKKPFVYDSDSESDQSKDVDYADKKNIDLQKTSNIITETKDPMVVKNTKQNVLNTNIECAETSNKEITLNSKKDSQLETSFGIDDVEMFSDNITSDPVIDNINALIANLDNDLEPSKLKTSTELTNNVTMDNMLENIDSGEDENFEAATENSNDLPAVSKINCDQSAKSKDVKETSSSSNIDIDSKISATSNDNIKKIEVVELCNTKPINNDLISTDHKPDFTELTEPVNCLTKSSTLFDIVASKLTSDNMVSTTEQNSSENIKEKVLNDESSSIPDSTNEVSSNNTVMEESFPDSTNETQTDTNSIVTSSHDSLDLVNKESAESCLASKDATSIHSIGNILSILQDKSKLKEMLSLLSDKSSENEKIKKKLEKLSEIVSDDDDEKEKSPCVPSVTLEKNPSVTSAECHESESANLNVSEELLNKSNDTDSPMNETDNTNPTTGSDIILEEVNTKLVDDEIETQFDNVKSIIQESEMKETVIKENTVRKKKPPTNKKGKFIKKAKNVNQNIPKGVRRITRSAILQKKVKKPSRELLKLQEDIKEMFISDEVLNATGIRMCRLAKLVDDKKSKEDTGSPDSSGPMVVLEKFKDTVVETVEKKTRKKPGPKAKIRPEHIEIEPKASKGKPLKFKPGPKSKTKLVNKSDDEDPYAFECDSVSENNFSTRSVDNKGSSDSENESIGSSQSFGSTDLLIELKKKPKRKRSNWQSGIIKPKNRKKKPEPKLPDTQLNDDKIVQKKSINIPDKNFTDKLYCFYKNIFTYSCRMCVYSGDDIVNHYKQEHPHSEIPLSRLSPDMAKEAIEQCEEINFQTISKLFSEKYVCRFCFKEFAKKKAVLETFFWHVVSMHTGEYKQLCSLCPSSSKCPFNLDIPPPPKDVKGQLIGYICEKCNFTQISLENLKTHVIVRHNDEQTEVYTINLSATSRLAIVNALSSQNKETEKPRMLRSTRANQSATKAGDDQSDVTDSDLSNEPLSPSKRKQPKKSTSPAIDKPLKPNIQSKITFENDDNASEASTSAKCFNDVIKVKVEKEEESPEKKLIEQFKNNLISEICNEESLSKATDNNVPGDIFAYPHFKITYTNGGSKEYVCCINGQKHYNTSLLISFKKHVQLKHSEIWDGYCCLCKVIVTSQGHHTFKDCLQHYLDKHMDNFPVLKTKETDKKEETNPPEALLSSNQNYINVRPISELMFKECVEPAVELPTLPKIESVVSLGAQTVEPPQESPIYQPALPEPPVQEKEYKYEEVQAEVMSKKHRVVLDTMMSKAKLVNVFKCAGRYCSFSSDSAEEALLHASTHQRVGGESSLSCAYCDFDCAGNAIDLVMHVFKAHGTCPYVCGYCFYRAAASQLITAHITRMHSALPQRILSAVNVPPPKSKDSSMLPREVVVRYYECPHACKFRTYTAGKYCEHLEQRHSGIPWQNCFLCTESLPSAAQLVHHLKSHELNLYQCPWCLHGADSEPGLMFHASQRHPAKQPQAYLRVITNKDGSSEFRVLPLASFNKSKVYVEEVAPISNKENPVREAERSIDLEKLIGHTNQMIESMAQAPEPAAPPTETETAVTSIIMNEPDVPSDNEPQSAATILESTIQPKRPVTPPTTTAINEQVTPKIKIEPTESAIKNMSNEIVCLDSDEEEPSIIPGSQSSVISLSDDDNGSQTTEPSAETSDEKRYNIICPTKLYTCPNCAVLYKNPFAFKNHLNTCCSKLASLQCPHCDMSFADGAALYLHFIDHSGNASRLCLCGVCNEKFQSLILAKRHMRYFHKITKYEYTNTKSQDETVCVVTAKPDPVPVKEKYLNVCDVCQSRFTSLAHVKRHLRYIHKVTKYSLLSRKNQDDELECVVGAAAVKPSPAKRKLSTSALGEPPAKLSRFGPTDIDRLPINPILDECVTCSLCEFKTKVRLNMVRHLQQHGEQQPVPQTAPINPVPHLETNEKHFDKMLNLASSSIVSRASDKPLRENPASQIPPEAAARYPKYVGERTRHTCGARGCSYISVDEAMLRCHWATLHAGTTDFHCVHCPPYQHLDTSKPLTPARIIAHLKMHDSTLYACSTCPYYHYKKQVVEKHLQESHKNDGRVLVVREDASAPNGSAQPASAPTMDLKPWQCGLCSFKSMLRPEVVEHCAKLHQSKMQFRCYYCPFRTSALENVTKHQTNSHPGKKPEVCYYYYREGSIPDDDGPRWMKQRQKFGTPENLEVKSEVDAPTAMSLKEILSAPPLSSLPSPGNVDLNIVKKEVDDAGDLTMDQLIRKYGEYCKPNGLKYKCPLCQVSEETREAIQSHLYEELSYRKWGCPMCEYKGFHKARLNEHFVSEHRGQNIEPIQQPTDVNIEKWVFHLIETQNKIIVKAKENLPTQRAKETEKQPPLASTSKQDVTGALLEKSADKFGTKQLEEAFGPFGEPVNSLYCCPKCNFKVKEEVAMRDHLENELTKIRWCCSKCSNNFQTYHEAQFHCKSSHAGSGARPVEAARDPGLRAAWPAAVLRAQARDMRAQPAAPGDRAAHEPDNSLLVVRFEKAASVTAPTEPTQLQRKRSAPDDSDDESYEPAGETSSKCPHCSFRTRYPQCLRDHEFRHYNLKPLSCNLCQYTGYRGSLMSHLMAVHRLPADMKFWTHTVLPTGPPTVIDVKVCRKSRKVGEDSGWRPESREPGLKVIGSREAKDKADREKVKCNICKDVINVVSMHEHHEDEHSTVAMSYTFVKPAPGRILVCGHCTAQFKDLQDLTAHHSATHNTSMLKYTTAHNLSSTLLDSDDDFEPASGETPVVPHRMVARKSTSKLPAQAVAKKSTTKLPYDVEYSYYGTKPTPMDQYENVTTLMAFSNAMVPLTVKKFSELLQINPVVRVENVRTSEQPPQ